MHNWPQDAHQYSTRLQRATIRNHPYCQHCGTTQNLETDHIIPLAEGGTNHPNNLQVLCHTCHQYKTRQEATRGTQRRQARKHKPTTQHPAYTQGRGVPHLTRGIATAADT